MRMECQLVYKVQILNEKKANFLSGRIKKKHIAEWNENYIEIEKKNIWKEINFTF